MDSWWDSLRIVTTVSWISRFAVPVFSVLVVVLGWREYVLQSKVKSAEKVQAEKNKIEADTKIASLQVEAERLRSDAEASKKDIAIAQAQAAQANEKAEAERLKRTQLEATLMPRILIMTRSTTDQLKLFPKTSVGIEFDATDTESSNLVGSIKGYLRDTGGWSVQLMPMDHPLAPYDMVLVLIKERPDTNGTLSDAAKILSYWLRDCGIAANCFTRTMTRPSEAWSDFPADTIRVKVGKKSQSYVFERSEEAFLDRIKQTDPNMYKDLAGAKQSLKDAGLGQSGMLRDTTLTKGEIAERQKIIDQYTHQK